MYVIVLWNVQIGLSQAKIKRTRTIKIALVSNEWFVWSVAEGDNTTTYVAKFASWNLNYDNKNLLQSEIVSGKR